MGSLEGRINELERRAPREQKTLVFIREIVSPEPESQEVPCSVMRCASVEVHRMAEEDVEPFKARALAQIARALPGRANYRVILDSVRLS